MLPWKPLHHRGKEMRFPRRTSALPKLSQVLSSLPLFIVIWETQHLPHCYNSEPLLWFETHRKELRRRYKPVLLQLQKLLFSHLFLLTGWEIQGIAATPTNNPKDTNCTSTPKILTSANTTENWYSFNCKEKMSLLRDPEEIKSRVLNLLLPNCHILETEPLSLEQPPKRCMESPLWRFSRYRCEVTSSRLPLPCRVGWDSLLRCALEEIYF